MVSLPHLLPVTQQVVKPTSCLKPAVFYSNKRGQAVWTKRLEVSRHAGHYRLQITCTRQQAAPNSHCRFLSVPPPQQDPDQPMFFPRTSSKSPIPLPVSTNQRVDGWLPNHPGTSWSECHASNSTMSSYAAHKRTACILTLVF